MQFAAFIEAFREIVIALGFVAGAILASRWGNKELALTLAGAAAGFVAAGRKTGTPPSPPPSTEPRPRS